MSAIISAIQKAGSAIAPLHSPILAPGPRDWLSCYGEPGQTFLEYLASDPPLPTRDRTTLYVQPFGTFGPDHETTVAATADVLGRFCGVPVRMLDPIDANTVPAWARRQNPHFGQEQLLTRFILDILIQNMPTDAAAVLALTTSDLWPGKGWNFMFGQASFDNAVGVWSLHRLGESGTMGFLRRTVQIAIHETGHMFGIRHCTNYHCGMNGVNNLEEADRHPVWFCPEDEMKIWYGFGLDPEKRYRDLFEFAEKHGLDREAAFWRLSEQAVHRQRLCP